MSKNNKPAGNPIENLPKSHQPTKEPSIIARYRKLYPSSKKFHVTSDGNVFLENDLHLAMNHQKTLKSGELKTY